MIKIFFYIFLFLLIYDRLTRAYVNPYRQILCFGLKGSGKTTLLTKYAIQGIKRGQQVYCSEKIPGTTYFDIRKCNELTPLPNSLILIDEIGILINNRDFMKYGTDYIKWWKMTRQLKLNVICFTQVFDEMDKKVRDLFDELWQVKNFARIFSVRRRIIKKIGIIETVNGSDIKAIYKYGGLIGGIKFTFIPRYTEFFNSYNPPTYEYVNLDPLPFTEKQKRYISTSQWIKGKTIDLLKRNINKTIKPFSFQRKSEGNP